MPATAAIEMRATPDGDRRIDDREADERGEEEQPERRSRGCSARASG